MITIKMPATMYQFSTKSGWMCCSHKEGFGGTAGWTGAPRALSTCGKTGGSCGIPNAVEGRVCGRGKGGGTEPIIGGIAGSGTPSKALRSLIGIDLDHDWINS